MSGARALRWPRPLGAQLAAAVLMALLPALGLLVARSGWLFPGGASRPVGSSAAPAPRMTTGDLPQAALGPASAAIGAVEPSYRVRREAAGARALNRGQGFAATFTSVGLRVSSKSLGLGMRMTAAGFGGSLAAIAPAAPTASANRVTYDRPGMQEWYANGPFGLEQGFTVGRPVTGAAEEGTYTVEMTLSGTASSVLTAHGSAVVVRSGSGGTLRYDGLQAVDASDRLLRSWMSLHEGTLSLHVDMAGAKFPVSIDPFLTGEGLAIELGEAKGEAPEKPQFGVSVALSGDGSTALVGAPDGLSKTGAAWIFHREGPVWTQQGKELTGPSKGEEGACEGENKGSEEEPISCAFGGSVALSGDGDTALIGAPGAGSKPGVAWVLNRSGSEWSKEPELLTAPVESGQQAFGVSVALSSDGNFALIGARSAPGGGQAYMFERANAASPWKAGVPLVAKGQVTGGHFGFSVALSADAQDAIVGAPNYEKQTGAAFVFERVGNGWTQDGVLTGAGESGEGRFGESVAMAAEGTPPLSERRPRTAKSGALWTFKYLTGRWRELGELLGPGNPKEEFGRSLALSADGGYALVGAPKANEGAGAVTLYQVVNFEWQKEQVLEAGPAEKGNGQFGKSVAMTATGQTVLAGAPHESNKAGAVWLFGKRPTVEAVIPPKEKGRAKGHLEGGNKVLVVGQNLATALAVWFGPYKTERIEHEPEEGGKEKLLVQVPPADESAEVDVTVETADWVSAINTNDGYTYTEGPTEEGGEKEKEKKSHQGNQGVPIGDILNPQIPGTGTTTATTKPGGGVAGSTSTPAPAR